MSESPFIFGKTVSTKSFTNREKDKKRLKDNLLQGINTILISPRRWGKSSLVEKVVAEINQEQKKVKTISLDLFSANNEQEFLELLAKETIKSTSDRWEDWVNLVKSVFQAIIPKISMGLDPQSDFSLSFDIQELEKHRDEILNLPEVIAEKKGLRLIVCLDEFQNLAYFDNYTELEKNMRAVWQRQKRVTYCLYGSKRNMMTEIFNHSSKPFYRFGDLMMLQKISGEAWTSYIISSFEDTGKKIEEKQAGEIALKMKNHSWYVQQLAHYTWTRTSKSVNSKILSEALEELISANIPFYQREVEGLSRTQINLLKAVSAGVTRLTGQEAMSKFALGTPRNVLKNKQSLMESDILDESKEEGYTFLDPAFELWFRRTFRF